MMQLSSLLGILVFSTTLKKKKKKEKKKKTPPSHNRAGTPTHSLPQPHLALRGTARLGMTCVQLISLSALLFLHLTASTVSFLPFRVPPSSIYSNNTAWSAFLDIHVVIHRLSLYLFVYVHVLRVGLQFGTLHCLYIDTFTWLGLV